jgi:phosphoserine phosphatase
MPHSQTPHSHVLTLIAAPNSGALAQEHVRRWSRKLGDAARGEEAPIHWLATDDACDIYFTPRGELDVLRKETAERLASDGLPFDWAIQSRRGRRKRLLIADMDSTIIQQECLDEIADFAGVGARIASITERAMRGELQFEPALRERIGLLEGFEEAALQRVFDDRITLTSGARTLAATMRAHGAHTVLVSGGFTFFTSRVAALAGFAAHRANRFVFENGRLTGVAEPILGREAKLQALREEAAALGIPLESAMAVGDGANDLAMIKAAGLGVAFRAKDVVAAEADACIRHGDLTALLYLQGYGKAEFAG